jgi:hypothetical protein
LIRTRAAARFSAWDIPKGNQTPRSSPYADRVEAVREVQGGLTSAQRKLLRGIEHLKTLGGEAEAFEDLESYFFESEKEAHSPEAIEYRCFAVERQPPPDHWPLLAGEAIQNLRSALDHAIYATTGNRRSQFPIFTDACEFEVLGGRMVKGVSKAVRARVEAAQPYVLAPQSPAQHSLAVLNSLSNLDKHRVLATLASAVDFEWVGVPEGVGIKWIKAGTNRPLGHGKTHVSTLVAYAETEGANVDVHPSFSYEVRIEGRPLNTLVGIAREVFRVVSEVETGEPLSPFAPYPI